MHVCARAAIQGEDFGFRVELIRQADRRLYLLGLVYSCRELPAGDRVILEGRKRQRLDEEFRVLVVRTYGMYSREKRTRVTRALAASDHRVRKTDASGIGGNTTVQVDWKGAKHFYIYHCIYQHPLPRLTLYYSLRV